MLFHLSFDFESPAGTKKENSFKNYHASENPNLMRYFSEGRSATIQRGSLEAA
jgi:hypothetical protein